MQDYIKKLSFFVSSLLSLQKLSETALILFLYLQQYEQINCLHFDLTLKKI